MLKVVPFLALLALMAYATTPSGFTRLNEKYLVSNTQTNFLGAYISCKSFGYKMATVTTEEDDIRLFNSLKSRYNYWLGGIYADSPVFEPKWMWIDSGNEMTYTHWAPGEPSLLPGNNCVERRFLGDWVANSCNLNYSYICEI